jgi:hypothetical protein
VEDPDYAYVTSRGDASRTPSQSCSAAAAGALEAPASKAILAGLLALPVGMVNRTSHVKSKGKSKARKLVKDGQAYQRFFNPVAGRPRPDNGISLEQSISLEMTFAVPSFFTTSTSNPTFASLMISANSFSGTPFLVTVFDQYKVDQLEVWLEPINPASSGTFPMLYTSVDLDDAAVPTNVGQVQDKPGALVGLGGGGRYHKWKPHIAVASYSGTFTSYSNMVAGWIDSASPSVTHFGLKIAASPGLSAVSYDLTVRAIMSWRAPVIN